MYEGCLCLFADLIQRRQATALYFVFCSSWLVPVSIDITIFVDTWFCILAWFNTYICVNCVINVICVICIMFVMCEMRVKKTLCRQIHTSNIYVQQDAYIAICEPSHSKGSISRSCALFASYASIT